jgi:very long chain acyl-CoA dehydrogenase
VAQSKLANTPQKQKEKVAESPSFAMNLFRGQLKLDEVFPFPNTLSDEQKETLQALVDPTAKFFEVLFLNITYLDIFILTNSF